MSVPFRPDTGLIVIRAILFGPEGDTVVRMALDTAATRTLIVPTPLLVIGYDQARASEHRKAATVSGLEQAPVVKVHALEALGYRRSNLSVLCKALPDLVGVDGLLGLDFFRGRSLKIDFRAGEITLN